MPILQVQNIRVNYLNYVNRQGLHFLECAGHKSSLIHATD